MRNCNKWVGREAHKNGDGGVFVIGVLMCAAADVYGFEDEGLSSVSE
jgi:hypothetical protein